MELIVAQKLHDLDLNELISLLTKLRMEDQDAFRALREAVEEIL